MSRADLFAIIKVRKLRDFNTIISTVGNGTIGCEICKPVVGSIVASLHGEFVMAKGRHGLQDTNDRFLANIQRDGKFKASLLLNLSIILILSRSHRNLLCRSSNCWRRGVSYNFHNLDFLAFALDY